MKEYMLMQRSYFIALTSIKECVSIKENDTRVIH